MKKQQPPRPKYAAPKPTGELRREARLARIAGALASGATITEIAANEGISRVIASRQANSPECRHLIVDFVDEERELMLGLCYRATRAIEDALDATREYTTKDGKVFHGGPDHYARLAATKHLRELLSAGRPPAAPIEQQRTLTLEDLERILAAHQPEIEARVCQRETERGKNAACGLCSAAERPRCFKVVDPRCINK